MNWTFRICFTTVFCFLLWIFSIGQSLYTPEIKWIDSTNLVATEILPEEILLPVDSLLIDNLKDTIVSVFRRKSFLAASVDSITLKDTLAIYHTFLGKSYSLGDLDINISDQLLLEGSGFAKVDWSKRLLSQNMITEIQDRVLNQLAQIGYPFAAVYLDSIHIQEGVIDSRLVIDKGEFITYDSITILGTAKINKLFLSKYLQIEKNNPYRHRDILEMKNRIRDLSFLTFKEDPYLTFVNQKAYLQLPLDNRNASRFDFIIGVLPRTEDGVRKWTITGDFTGEFVNKLGNGESILLQYQQLQPETQELDIALNYPYFLNMPFGIDGAFSLYRNTTNFLELLASFGIQYQLSGKNYLKIGWNYHSSRLIEVDTNRILNTGRLPDQLDVNLTGGNVTLGIDMLDYTFNPTAGLSGVLRIEAGQKKIIPNNNILSLSEGEMDFTEAYDTLQLSTFQAQIGLHLDYFVRIQNWATARLANRTAYKYNQATVFDNEFYRIGGNKLLRGFNEQSILSPGYSIFTGEFRIILDQLSYISLPFIDYGMVNTRDVDGQLQWENMMGVGIGLNFGTKAGIFNISFASGRRKNIPFNFGDTKIHFGYVNLF